MKQTLINRYMAGATTHGEEVRLRQLLADIPSLERTPQEQALLDVLSLPATEEEEDIFAVDYADEYNKVAHPRRLIRPWPWLAAACVVGIVAVLLTPPEVDVQPQEQSPLAQQDPVADTHIAVPPATPSEEPHPHLAQSEQKTVQKTRRSRPTTVQPAAIARQTDDEVPPTPEDMDEERQIREIMRRQAEHLQAIEQEMNQVDIRSEILLRGKRMRHTYAVLEDE